VQDRVPTALRGTSGTAARPSEPELFGLFTARPWTRPEIRPADRGIRTACGSGSVWTRGARRQIGALLRSGSTARS